MVKFGRALACLVACVGAVLTTPAIAQSMAISVSSPRQHFSPEYTRTDIGIIARVLALSDGDREPLMALHEGYVAALRERGDALGEAIEERIERAQATMDVEGANAKPEETEAWEKEAKEIKEGFLNDMKSLLTGAQADRWPLAEREMRRFKQIGSGRLGGEAIDLVRIVEESLPEAWATASVAEVLLRYAESMDGALKARQEAIGGERSGEFEAMLDKDKAAALKMWEDAQAKRIAVRDLNLRYAEQIAGLLSGEKGTQFRRLVFEKSYPGLVKPSRSENVIRAAAALTTLSDSQREQIRGIVDAYDVRRLALLREMAAVLKEKQEKKKPSRLDAENSNLQVATTDKGETISFYSSASLKRDDNDPMNPLHERRYELDRGTRRKIEAVLSQEQRDAIRQPPQDMILIDFEEVWGL